MLIYINMDKAKEIAHTNRRIQREAEFKPLDELLMKQIPGTDTEVIEQERNAIREKYRVIQEKIDAATTPEEILAAFE